MTVPEFSGVLVLLERCRDRIAVLTAGAATPLYAELSALREQLDAAVAELGAARPAARRAAPTPATLRKLLTLAREDLAAQLTTSETPLEQLTTIVSLAERLVPGTQHATVSVIRDVDEIETLVATSSVGRRPTACRATFRKGLPSSSASGTARCGSSTPSMKHAGRSTQHGCRNSDCARCWPASCRSPGSPKAS